ncbi:hypothetical protein [Neorhizobium sp. T6_25]|uniref:hypothetical protein n=1 Tax=Neorhizobium sp. T6_25 TaxID=2093833 RepID=UPI001FE0A70B|nr:hypothetical protein [Neorhizobium sp. T6_25]
MSNTKFFAGKTVGRLKLICEAVGGWKCECSCGREPIFSEEALASVRSCGCIVILGLDLATNSGWAVRYSWRNAAAIKCGTFNVAENDSGEEVSWETKYALTSTQVYKLIIEHKPDFVAIEEPEHRVTQFNKKKKNPVTGAIEESSTINPNALQLSGISGAAIGVCMMMGVACGTIPSRSWHSKYHGKGVKPEPKEDWKDVAIRSCEREHVPLPPTKKAQRDAAEAVCISACWHWCSVLDISWMRKRWMDLRTGAAKALAQRQAGQVAA